MVEQNTSKTIYNHIYWKSYKLFIKKFYDIIDADENKEPNKKEEVFLKKDVNGLCDCVHKYII